MLVLEDEIDQDEDRKGREDDEGVVDRHERAVDESAHVAGGQADGERDDAAEKRDRYAEEQAVADGERELPEDILTARIGAEGVVPGRRQIEGNHVLQAGWVRRYERGQRHGDDQQDQDRAEREFAIVAEEVLEDAQHCSRRPDARIEEG
jgi:hypothetical protein